MSVTAFHEFERKMVQGEYLHTALLEDVRKHKQAILAVNRCEQN
jgi:hypothetical protein